MKNDSEMLIKYTIRLEAKNAELEKKLKIAVKALEFLFKEAESHVYGRGRRERTFAWQNRNHGLVAGQALAAI